MCRSSQFVFTDSTIIISQIQDIEANITNLDQTTDSIICPIIQSEESDKILKIKKGKYSDSLYIFTLLLVT